MSHDDQVSAQRGVALVEAISAMLSAVGVASEVEYETRDMGVARHFWRRKLEDHSRQLWLTPMPAEHDIPYGLLYTIYAAKDRREETDGRRVGSLELMVRIARLFLVDGVSHLDLPLE